MDESKLDKIGRWTEVKLEIVKEYARPYSLILTKQGEKYPTPFRHIYIDAFAGAGRHFSRRTKEIVDGSPRIALNIEPPFCEYHFIDMDEVRAKELEKLKDEYHDKEIFVYSGNSNDVLIKHIFPRVERERFGKGLCLLDPYGLHLSWKVVEAAGKTGDIEIFVNFPIMDMHRNVFRHDKNKVKENQLQRMNDYWGNERWQDLVWDVSPQLGLFGEAKEEKSRMTERRIVSEYRRRLLDVAGFKFAPEPILMVNSKRGPIYYLFFASPNRTGNKIANGVIRKWRDKGLSYGR